jgi:hypothetical protein
MRIATTHAVIITASAGVRPDIAPARTNGFAGYSQGEGLTPALWLCVILLCCLATGISIRKSLKVDRQGGW